MGKQQVTVVGRYGKAAAGDGRRQIWESSG